MLFNLEQSVRCVFVSHHEHSDVGEEACSDDQQHHRPGKPEAQVPKVKPAGTQVRKKHYYSTKIKSLKNL